MSWLLHLTDFWIFNYISLYIFHSFFRNICALLFPYKPCHNFIQMRCYSLLFLFSFSVTFFFTFMMRMRCGLPMRTGQGKFFLSHVYDLTQPFTDISSRLTHRITTHVFPLCYFRFWLMTSSAYWLTGGGILCSYYIDYQLVLMR